MYWIGYVYRYLHYYRNETNRRIIRTADFQTMRSNYSYFYAIDDLIEISLQKKKKTRTSFTSLR